MTKEKLESLEIIKNEIADSKEVIRISVIQNEFLNENYYTHKKNIKLILKEKNKIKNLKKVEKDLQKYSKFIKLLKELLKEIETDKLTIMSSGKPEIIKYCLVRLELDKMESMHINKNTYNIVEKLKELVGVSYD